MQQRSAAEVVRLAADEGVQIVDLRFCDLPGLMQHFSVPAHELTEEAMSEGYGFDGSSIRGFQQIHESDMILLPDPSTAVIDPFRQHKTLNMNCFVHDPVTLEPYSRDPAPHRQEGRGISQVDRHRRHVVLRARSGVLHLRRCPVLPGPAFGLLHGGLDGGHLELGSRRSPEPRVQTSLQGGVLPGASNGQLPGPALRDDPDHGEDGHRDRGAAPRGGHRRPSRDRHALRHAALDGRQAHALQVRGQERGPRCGIHRHLHAQAALPGQRVGHARAPVALAGR